MDDTVDRNHMAIWSNPPEDWVATSQHISTGITSGREIETLTSTQEVYESLSPEIESVRTNGVWSLLSTFVLCCGIFVYMISEARK